MKANLNITLNKLEAESLLDKLAAFWSDRAVLSLQPLRVVAQSINESDLDGAITVSEARKRLADMV